MKVSGSLETKGQVMKAQVRKANSGKPAAKSTAVTSVRPDLKPERRARSLISLNDKILQKMVQSTGNIASIPKAVLLAALLSLL